MLFRSPGVSRNIFETFNCVRVQIEGNSYAYFMSGELSVRCYDSDRHKGLVNVSIWLIAWWTILVPCGFFLLLWMCRTSIQAHRTTPLSRATSILHRDYRTEVYAWELFELLRKITLTGFILLIPPSFGTVRIIVAFMISLIHMALILLNKPFRDVSNQVIGAAASMTLVVTFVSALLCRIHERAVTLFGTQAAFALVGFERIFPITLVLFTFTIGMLCLIVLVVCRQLSGQQRTAVIQLVRGGQPILSLGPDLAWHVFLVRP